MPLGKLKQQSLLKHFKKELKKLPETRTPNQKKIHSVAILTTEVISSEINIAKYLKESIDSVRNIHIYSYRKYKKSDPITYKHFTEKDFFWSGKVKDPSFESFIDNPFDLLICYYNEKNLYLELAAVQSKASFKIGFSSPQTKIFDIMVEDDPKNIEAFFKVVKEYLHLLNKI